MIGSAGSAPRRRRRRLRRLATSSARCSTRGAARVARRRQPALGRARERARRRAGRVRRGLDRRRRRARRAARTSSTTSSTWRPTTATRARSRPARRPREQPDHDAEAATSALKDFERLQKRRLLGLGLHAAPSRPTARPRRRTEDGPVPLDLDSPYQISKVVGEFYSVYYHRRHGLPTVRARFQNVYGPGEILGAGRWRGTPATVWRNVTPTFVYRALKGLPLAARQRRRREPRLHLRRRHRRAG